MNKYCVIVRLTKSTICFRYQIDNDQVEFLTLNEKEPEIPLAFYLNGDELIMGHYAQERASMNDSNAFVDYFGLIKDRSKVFIYSKEQRPIEHLLYIGVERYLTFFLKEKLLSDNWSIESNRKEFPLRFAFANDLNNQERRYVVGLFVKAGYHNVTEISLEKTIFSTLAPSLKSKLLLSGLNGNLYMNIYPNARSTFEGNKILEGLGTDPRFTLCANIIFEELQKRTPGMYANKNDNLDLLIKEAHKVLQTNRPICQGDVTLNTGEKGEYQIELASLNRELNRSEHASTVISELEYYLKSENNIQPNDIDVILDGGVNTDYFANKLRQRFPSVINISSSDYVQIWNKVFQTVDLSSPVVEAPKLPPTNGLKRIPNLPPDVKNKKANIVPPPMGTLIKPNEPKVPPVPSGNMKKKSNMPPPPPPPCAPTNVTTYPKTPLAHPAKTKSISCPPPRPNTQNAGLKDVMSGMVGVGKAQIKGSVSMVSSALKEIGQKFAEVLDINSSIIVGRDGSQKIKISDKTVSPEHCKLTRLEDGSFLVENLSAKGTYINGVKLDKGFAKLDDIIGLGPNFNIKLRELI